MDRTLLAELARRFLAGTATEQEKALLHQWFDTADREEIELVFLPERETEEDVKKRIFGAVQLAIAQEDEPVLGAGAVGGLRPGEGAAGGLMAGGLGPGEGITGGLRPGEGTAGGLGSGEVAAGGLTPGELAAAERAVGEMETRWPPRRIGRYVRWVAAACVLVAISVAAGYFWNARKAGKADCCGAPVVNVRKDVPPGSNKATLLLGDGSVVNLGSAQNGVIRQVAGTEIDKSDGQLIYRAGAAAGGTSGAGADGTAGTASGTTAGVTAGAATAGTAGTGAAATTAATAGEAATAGTATGVSTGKAVAATTAKAVAAASGKGAAMTKDIAPEMNTIETPRGGQYQVVLPDGTRVWLNAASSLSYPTAFVGKDRQVELKGEAYFEVAQNKDKPFAVVVGRVRVGVLGTHFNVMAYDDENAIRTTLLEGAVKVTAGQASHLLASGQEAAFDRSTGSLKTLDVDAGEAIAWKNGVFRFSGVSIETVMREIARWYDVDVEYQGKTKEHFRGTISRSVNVSEVFRMLELTGAVHFTVEGKKVIVRP